MRVSQILPQIKSLVQNLLMDTRFWLSAHNNFLFISFYKYLYKPSKNSLQEFLHFYSLSKKGNFVVIQIGANDGITFDPIHKFIKRDKWKGILLEPQRDLYEKYLSKLYKKNPGIISLCAAIGDVDEIRPIYKIGFSNMRWASGLASFSKSKVEKTFEDGIVAYNCSHFGITIPEDKTKWIIEESVKVVSPKTLLSTYNINDISLLQIDAEGYDYEVIKIFNIKETSPAVIVFENVGLSEKDYQDCIDLLKTSGYSVRHFGQDTVAMKNPPVKFQKYFS